MTFPTVQLRRLSTVANGGTPTPDAANWDGGIPWATPVDLGRVNGRILTATERTLTRAGAERGSTVVPSGSVILSTRAPIGYTAVAGLATAFNQGCKALVPFDGVDSRYLRYALDSTSQALTALGRGSTFLELNSSDLAAHRVSRPSLVVQRQVADYLDHETAEIDAFIADLGLFRRLEDERLDASIDMAFRVSDARWAPFKRLGMIQSAGVSVNGASWPAEVGAPGVLKTGSVSQGVFEPDENKAVINDMEIARLTCPVVADSIIVNRANTPDLVGRAVYVNTEHPTLYLSDLLWRVKFPGGLTEYVGAWMLTRTYRDAVRTIRVGASSTMQKISFERFSSIAIPLPEESARRSAIEDARRLTASRTAMRADIDAAVALAKERRVALIRAAVTGQIDVTIKQTSAVDSIQTAIEEAR